MHRIFHQFSIASAPEMHGTYASETAQQKTLSIVLDEKMISSSQLVGFENFYNQIQMAQCSQAHEDVFSYCDIVIIPGNHSAYEIDLALLWIGVYNILHRDHTVEAYLTCVVASEILRGSGISDIRGLTSTQYSERETTLKFRLQAFEQAKAIGWFVDSDSQDEPILVIEEFAHYADIANGAIHLAVPGALIFFPTPTILDAHQEWINIEPRDGRHARLFSPTYYAALFQDFGVSCVVCLGRTDPAVVAAFKAHGIETEDLGMAADGSSLLRGLDRLLSLARAAPGTLAPHSGEGFEWPRCTATLAKAFMMSRLGFAEGSAGAWLEMTCPWMPGHAAPAASAPAPPAGAGA
jgi:hypothetical protein